MKQQINDKINTQLNKEAKLLYLDSDYDILKSGDHVLCAASGEKIPLAKLKYWSAEYQEAYKDAQYGFQQFLKYTKNQ